MEKWTSSLLNFSLNLYSPDNRGDSAMNEQRINDALQVLYEEGLQGYKPEYRDEANRWGAIGKAIAQVESQGINFARIAYEALEDWNYHDACAVLDWTFPKMHGMNPDSPAVDYMDTLKRIKRVISRPYVSVFTDWNRERVEYDVARYRVDVLLTKLD